MQRQGNTKIQNQNFCSSFQTYFINKILGEFLNHTSFTFINILLGHCPVDHYQCSDKRCVRTSLVCDGKKDCFDNSDEVEGCKGIDA